MVLKLLRPRQTVGFLTDIDIDALMEQGIRGLLMDLDNTIVA